jgi:selenocysteine-specific elongation factor
MKMKHLIMGTAGHVDHGKTALIRALTGNDCDTHLQEKQRGITINLGFTNIRLSSGNSVGIVDVPGHADFINTMVSGACGIDFVLLVIAADEGIMPQTREHLQIMELLGIKRGIIVLNKSDLVDEELLELAEEEVSEFVEGTFLSGAKIQRVSSLTKSGIEDLIEVINSLVDEIPSRSQEGNFRMYIDRIFTVKGFGVVVNGSVLSGRIASSDILRILPVGSQVRIRRIERHGKEVSEVQAGDRASLNLVGFREKEFRQGLLLSSHEINPSTLIDVKLRLFRGDTKLGIWNQLLFLMGTVKQMVRVHLLDRDKLNGGEECLAQIYLPRAIIALLGDKFIIRKSSGDITLGGGEVIDPYPLHHRRRRQQQIEIVKRLSSGDISEIIAAEVRKSVLPIALSQISSLINQGEDNLTAVVYDNLSDDISFFQGEHQVILLQTKQKEELKRKILSSIEQYSKQNPLSEEGRGFQELMGIFGEERNEVTKESLRLILEEMESEYLVRRIQQTWVLYNHSVEIDKDFGRKIETILSYLLESGYNVPLMSGIEEVALANGIEDRELRLILQQLVKKDEIIHYQNSYLHKRVVMQAQAKLTGFLREHEGGISLAEYRDLLSTNRKMASLLLEYFDKKGITIRRDNTRQFTSQYKKTLQD